MTARSSLVAALLAVLAIAPLRAEELAEEGLPLPTRKAPARKPIVVLGYYAQAELPRILEAAKRDGIGTRTPVYGGSYGISEKDSKALHALPLGRYAPMFTLVRKSSIWNARPGSVKTTAGFTGALAPAGHVAGVAVAGVAIEGPVPAPEDLAKLPASERWEWAVEVGRRFRDEIRAARKTGTEVESWQFDEISPKAGDPVLGPRVRFFARGVLEGLHLGRKELGDQPLPGIAYISNSAFRMGELGLTPEMRELWATLDHTCLAVVGEEYPTFAGKPEDEAKHEARLQLELEKLGGPAARVARKWISGCSPGYLLGVSLGGNVLHWSRARMNAWRRAFLVARAKHGVAGFGEFDFLRENDSDAVYADTFAAVKAAIEAD